MRAGEESTFSPFLKYGLRCSILFLHLAIPLSCAPVPIYLPLLPIPEAFFFLTKLILSLLAVRQHYSINAITFWPLLYQFVEQKEEVTKAEKF